MSLVDSVTDKPQRDERGKLLPGHSRIPGSGRKRGSRNQLADTFIADLYDDWQQRGPSVIARVAESDPSTYLRVIAGLLPKDVNISVRQLDELSDEQLLSRLRQVTEMARPLLIDVTPVAGAEEAADAVDLVPAVVEPAKA